MQYDSIVIHYSEIGLKGKNREFFERKLIENIRIAIGPFVGKVYWMYGRIACELKENTPEETIRKIESILYNIPGIASFVFSRNIALDIETIKKTSLEVAEEKMRDILESRKESKRSLPISFKIAAKRSNKHFEYTSNELNIMIAEVVYDNLNGKYNLTVDLKSPDAAICIEVCEKNAFVYSDKITGLGGLPVGCSGKIISSISGGIDSPVASFMMM